MASDVKSRERASEGGGSGWTRWTKSRCRKECGKRWRRSRRGPRAITDHRTQPQPNLRCARPACRGAFLQRPLVTRGGILMWGLEYALLFGAPENKLELFDGRTPLSWPFPDRETAEAHFALWIETLYRWHGVAQPPTVRKTAEKWTAEINGFVVELYPRPIHLEIPFERDAFVEIRDSFWRRDLWPGQPAGREKGWESAAESSDIAHNLWRLFE